MTRLRSVALLGLLVLAASLLPWWRHEVSFDGPGGSGTLVETATAWGGPGYRSAPGVGLYAGVVLLLAQAVGAVRAARRPGAREVSTDGT